MGETSLENRLLLFKLVHFHWYASIIAAQIKLRKYIMNAFLEDRDATITTKVLPKNLEYSSPLEKLC